MRKLLFAFFMLGSSLFLLTCQLSEEVVPTGIFPKDGSALTQSQVDNIILRWEEHIFPGGQPLSYQIRIYESDTMISSGPIKEQRFNKIIEETVETPYFKPERMFKAGNLYAWEVAVENSSGDRFVIKDLASFWIKDPTKSQLRETDDSDSGSFNNFCTKNVHNENGDPILVTFPCRGDGPTIHQSTGSMSLIGLESPSAKAVSVGVQGNKVNNGCLELLPNNEIKAVCIFEIRVPSDQLDSIDQDEVIFKVFEDRQALPEDEIIFNFWIIKGFGTNRILDEVAPYEVAPSDYEQTFDEENNSFHQATVYIEAQFAVKKRTVATHRQYYRDYRVAFDLVPTGLHTEDNGGAHEHPENDPENECSAYEKYSYEYYDCLDFRKNSIHQGQHVVMLPINDKVFCNPLYKNTPVSVMSISEFNNSNGIN